VEVDHFISERTIIPISQGFGLNCIVQTHPRGFAELKVDDPLDFPRDPTVVSEQWFNKSSNDSCSECLHIKVFRGHLQWEKQQRSYKQVCADERDSFEGSTWWYDELTLEGKIVV